LKTFAVNRVLSERPDPAGIALTLTPYLAILRNGLRPARMD